VPDARIFYVQAPHISLGLELICLIQQGYQILDTVDRKATTMKLNILSHDSIDEKAKPIPYPKFGYDGK